MRRNGDLLELGRLLVELLSSRDSGLLSQAEYEQQLDEIRRTRLAPDQILQERDLSDGGTRFLIRRISTGQCMQMFEFHKAYSAER